MTEESTLEANQFFQVLKMIHAAMIAGVVMFMGVCFFLHRTHLHLSMTDDILLLLIAIVVTASFLPIALAVHVPVLKALKPGASLSQVQQTYQTICILRWALCEGPALFSLVAFLINSNLLFVVVVVVNLTVFVMKRPSSQEFIEYFQKYGIQA